MKALVLTGPGGIELQDAPIPRRPGECLVRVSMAGICGTDLQMLEGYADFRGILGHEFVGVVEDASGSDARWIGTRVVGEINVGCGRCSSCEAGVKEHCVDRSVVGIRQRDGASAELVSLPAANLHAVPDVIDDETAVFVEPVAAACRIFEQMSIDDRARVAVLGDGRMGLLVAQTIRTATPHVTLLGRHARKLAVAKALDLSAAFADDEVPPGSRYDVVVDVTGRPSGLVRALEIVRPRGTVVLKSTFHGEAAIESWPIVVDEVTIVGSRCGPFRPAIALLSSGAVQVKPLIARVAALDEHAAAFTDARTMHKVLFAMNPDCRSAQRGRGRG
jgi:threonine dehydrogenase-like Zn-dependent dehydrogenase